MISVLSKVSKVDEIHIDSLTSAGVYSKKSIYMDPINIFGAEFEKHYSSGKRPLVVRNASSLWKAVEILDYQWLKTEYQRKVNLVGLTHSLDTYQTDISSGTPRPWIAAVSMGGLLYIYSYILITPTHDILFFSPDIDPRKLTVQENFFSWRRLISEETGRNGKKKRNKKNEIFVNKVEILSLKKHFPKQVPPHYNNAPLQVYRVGNMRREDCKKYC